MRHSHRFRERTPPAFATIATAVVWAVIVVFGSHNLCAQGLVAPQPGQRAGASPRPFTQPIEGRNSGTVTETAAANPANAHPLIGCLRLAKEAEQALEAVNDYTASFTKKELVNGQLLTQQISLKLREKPFAVYLSYEQPSPGREVLYVQGSNNNQLLVHEGSGLKSLAGTVSLPVNAPQVLAESRHPVTELGLKSLLRQIIKQWELESQFGECEVLYYPEAKIAAPTSSQSGEPQTLNCIALECSHPQPRRQFPYQKIRLFLDRDSRLPVRLESYAFPSRPGTAPVLTEEYTFWNLKTGVGLQDLDFSPKNPKYHF